MKLLKGFSARWHKLMQGHGFALLVTICIGVITATAVWSKQPAVLPVIPTLPPYDDRQASALQQQSLQEAATPTPLPDSQPILWMPPLENFEMLRPFSADVLTKSGVTGLWTIHPGADLSSSAGTPVTAMADGVVKDCGKDALQGCWVALEHANGYTSHYAGLAVVSALRSGDRIRAGQTIGFIGSMLSEADLGPHLHLEVRKDGAAVDPISLLNLPD